MNTFRKSSVLLLCTCITLCLITLAGCAPVGPDYKPPEIKAGEKWNSQADSNAIAGDANSALAAWWNSFNDPQLTSLINRAAAGNLSLKEAQARLMEARAQRGIAQADMFPTLNASAGDTWTRSPDENGNGKTSQLFTTGFDAAWEMDIFGGVRRSIESATASMQATEEDLHDTFVSLAAETALNYVEVRTFQAEIRAVEENLKSQEETYQLTVWRLEAKLTDELAMQQARYNLESTRSQLPSLHSSLNEAMNRLAVLLGEEPGKLHEELRDPKPIPLPSSQIVIGVPADMLRRRPDIRSAERSLAAQTANIGVATAQLYPKFALNGSIGVDSPSFKRHMSNLSTPDNWVLSGGPSASWALFQGGAIRQNIKVQTAIQEQFLMQYEAAVLNALEEVENALTSYSDENKRIDSLGKATEAAQEASKLAQLKYESGLTDFTDVLDAQRSLLSFQNELAQSSGTVASDLIRLYKALGGGWTSCPAQQSLNPDRSTNENSK